ncbi:MAG: 1,4-alpha-glucan branching protein GlgB [Chitinivibrionales bacterium]|nr:1,4-alpha-glucan branching protein GlgB [Chitinivibrionales bacterium]
MPTKKKKKKDEKQITKKQPKEDILFSDFDTHLFKEGNHFRLYEKLGAHITEKDGVKGTHFALWAPNAQQVSVIGDFNGWEPQKNPLYGRWDESGIWENFVPGVDQGSLYKFHVVSHHNNYRVDKGDPFAFYWEAPPKTASVVWDLAYQWNDSEWMDKRKNANNLESPMAIYEVHLGSWQRKVEEDNRFLTAKEIAVSLVNYVKECGFTHVEFLPIMEHPFSGSWGYQTTGYFAPTSRFGTPQDLMFLIDTFHQNGIGVILDWVPSHFPSDEHGLAYFDGTHLFEHADPRQGFHPDWQTYIFNFCRNEVREFLISSALFWLEKYHVDGLRVDAVASMLYLDYSRKDGEWVPNKFGGRENIEAIEFLHQLNETAYSHFPGIQMMAEESTAWPAVSRPVYAGGLGFGVKWNMGWMHDTLEYFAKDPIFRKYHHNDLTFSLLYVFTENFVLPISHDEVVHGKGSLLNKMPGDDWQKFANLRLLLGYMWMHPGKKLLFMGSEIGQRNEWNHDASIDWHLLNYPQHNGIKQWLTDCNTLYKSSPALYKYDFSPEGFEWVDCSDFEQSIIIFLRKEDNIRNHMLVACNFTPTPRHDYRIGVPTDGDWVEMLNSDAELYGGSGIGNMGKASSTPVPWHGQYNSISITLPPLSIVVFKPESGWGQNKI